jgi:hypothetical protein
MTTVKDMSTENGILCAVGAFVAMPPLGMGVYYRANPLTIELYNSYLNSCGYGLSIGFTLGLCYFAGSLIYNSTDIGPDSKFTAAVSLSIVAMMATTFIGSGFLSAELTTAQIVCNGFAGLVALSSGFYAASEPSGASGVPLS